MRACDWRAIFEFEKSRCAESCSSSMGLNRLTGCMETRGQKSASKKRHDVSVGPPAVPEKVLALGVPDGMERGRLEALSDKQLRQQVWSYRLEEQGTREAMIDSIVAHLEASGPSAEMMGPPRSTVAEGPSEVRSALTAWDATAEALEGLTAAVATCMQQQHLILQKMGERMNGPLALGSATASGEGCPSGEADSRGQGRFAAPQKAVAFDERWVYDAPLPVTVLMQQIPEFGGADTDSVVT